jgi:hypothetical protein
MLIRIIKIKKKKKKNYKFEEFTDSMAFMIY